MSAKEKSNQKKNKPAATLKKIIQRAVITEEKSVTLKKEKTQVRYLKLKEFYLSRSSRSQKIVPELRLCGKWFEEAGFTPRDYVSVTVMDGLLVIRNVEAIATD